jgi:hypothetical protein
MEITYDTVEPLIARVQEDGETLVCSFVCPLTDRSYEGTGQLQKGRTLEDVSTVERSMLDSVRQSLAFLLRGALEDPRSKRALAGDAVMAHSGKHSSFSESERKAAVVLAFKSASSRFVWDAKGKRWIAAAGASELLTRFARQLSVASVEEESDRATLARMLVEVARADGKVTPTEWAFLGELIPGDITSVDTAMEQPDLSEEELGKVSKGACRDTMLMLTWALALTDEHMDADETGQLLRFAKGLRIPEERAVELRRYAQRHLLDRSLLRAFPNGKLKGKRHKEALALAKRIGLTAEETAEAEVDFKKRNGID